MTNPNASASRWRLVVKRRIAKTGRWLHIYASMASFAIVFFFAATGLTLNHADWFADQQRTIQVTGTIERAWLKTEHDGVAKLEIVEFLRHAHNVAGALSDFRTDEAQYTVSFRGPGYSADAFIDRETGHYDLTESRLGFAAVVNDLHKGRDTGQPWRLLIDISAALLVFIALSGLVLIYFVHKHRFAGLLALAGGAALSFGVYRLFVP